MKINEIEVGPVYWYDTRRDWGTWLATAYDRGPVVRVDAERYAVTTHSWSTTYRDGRADPKGRYVKVRNVNEDGSEGDEDPRVRFVQAAFIRDTMTAVRERYERQQAADKAAEERRQERTEAAAQQAADLRARLEVLGLSNDISVWHTNGQGYQAGPPKAHVKFLGDAGRVLADILDRLEQGQRDGRELAARRADMTPDPDWADRLTNGAYDRP